MNRTIVQTLQAKFVVGLAFVASVVGAVDYVNQYPVRVHAVKGAISEPEAGMKANEGVSTTLAWPMGGEQPVLSYDYGGKTVGGYAVFKVTGFKAQGTNADGKTVGYPVLRLSYSTHPDGLRATGDFTRRGCADYLGPTFDNPVLPANVNRFELYTITRTGTFIAPLLQGQERYVRIQLETPGTEVSVDAFEIRNTGVYSRETPVGSFRCSDERVNRAWDMSAWTCQIASFPNHDAWRVVDGKLLPRKLEKGTAAGLCAKRSWDGEGTWSADFELRTNPHFASAFGLMLRAQDVDDGVVVVATQPAAVQIIRRKNGINTLLCQKILDEPIVDGVVNHLDATVKGKNVSAWFNGVKIIDCDVADLDLGGKFGVYVEKEWWPVVHNLTVKDGKGRELFREDFSGADDEGRLPGWDYSKSFRFMADGAKRDRLVWIGDLWWAQRTCFNAFRPDWPYFRESLKLLAFNQTPEGYVWAAPYAETPRPPKSGEYGHFPSDEFSAWLVPITWDYYLHTADDETMKTLYPAVKKDLAYLTSRCREDGLFLQRIETSSHAACMPPNDPRTRVYMEILLWKCYCDGAKLARALGHAEDAAQWEKLAARLAPLIRKTFWDDKKKIFNMSLEQRNANAGAHAFALATEFATPEEALLLAPTLPSDAASKFHLLGLRGKFAYGFDEAAFNMLEGGAWFKLSDPSWEGAQCCTECGFLTRDGWWDESHPDTAVAGPITTYLLGVEPVTPGFKTFRFAPHVVTRLSFAEGKVPTPHGFISARWERQGDRVVATLDVPAGTQAEIAFPRAKSVQVDGRPNAGLVVAGHHEIVVEGMDAKALEDKSLLAGIPTTVGEQWYTAPQKGWARDSDPNRVFTHTIDFGAVRNLITVELTAGPELYFPRDVTVEVSPDGQTWTRQKELTGLVYPGEGKTIDVDLRTVGSSLSARYLRLSYCHPKPKCDKRLGIDYYMALFAKVRVKFRVD
ncbi:MAG: alpha-L-rhamnosidase C-terminal domain-containing protein [bacterium]|nr:alpha-L-rhamnosidase C-terminal domain-containing protein [bacterium]